MYPVKTIVAGLIVAVLLSECNKKKDDKDAEFASTSTTTSTVTPVASQEIFDEFYKEDSLKKTNENTVSETTPAIARAEVPSFSENGRFVVQVSTVNSKILADNISSKLSSKGYPAYVAEVENPTPSLNGTYYRVRIGGFDRISVARAFGENVLSSEGYEFWVDNRSNDNVGIQGGNMGSGDTYYSSQPSSSFEASTPAAADYSQPPAEPLPAAEAPQPVPVVDQSLSAPASKTTPPPFAPSQSVSVESESTLTPETPASSYTPESAAKEFETTPVESTTPPQQPPSATGTSTEWGNEGW